MPTQILPVATGAADSADLVLTTGSLIALDSPLNQARAQVFAKGPTGAYLPIALLSAESPTKTIAGDGTYRVSRLPGGPASACGVFANAGASPYKRPTHGPARLIPGDCNPNGTGSQTNHYKREAEAPFHRVRVHVYSLSTTSSTGWTGVIAPTETPLADNANNRYAPMSGGVAKNSLQSSSNPDGWRALTFGGSSSGTIPAAPASNRPSVLTSDWIECASLPRTDASLRHLLLARLYHNGSAGNNHTISSGPVTGTGMNAWNAQSGQPWYRQFRSAQYNGDAVGTLGNMPGGGFEDGNWPFWVDFEFDYGLPTRSIACFADSTWASGGFQLGDYGQWLAQAVGRKSTPAAPIAAFNGAMSSQSTATFMKYLGDLVSAGVKFTDVVVPIGSPNDSPHSKYVTSQNKALVLNALDLCDAMGARLFLATRIPNDLYSAGNANEDQRLAQNAFARQFCADNPDRVTLVDFDAVLSNGAYPGRFAPGYRGDDFHQSAAGIAAMADQFYALL